MSEGFLTDLRTLIDADSLRSTRVRYSSGAGLTRIPSLAVAFPRTSEQATAAFDLARAHDIPLTARGSDTSYIPDTIGPGLVFDFSRHMSHVVSIDPEARTAIIELGCVGSALQAVAGTHGLRFGPDPSFQNRATIAGMVANNAYGPHATARGRICDSIVSLDCIGGQGRRFTATTGHDGALSDMPGLALLIDSNLAPIYIELGQFKCRVSGYSPEYLTPEGGRNLAAMLTGAGGTLVLILSTIIHPVPLPEALILAALGCRSMIDVADDVPALLAYLPLVVEGMNRCLVDIVRAHKGPDVTPTLPEGDGWLLIKVDALGEDLEVTLERAHALCVNSAVVDTVVYPSGAQASVLWRIRTDSAGLSRRTPPDDMGGGGQRAWSGFEDAAIPPESLGNCLRDFTALMEKFDIDGLLYGHFGDGCVHVCLTMPLNTLKSAAHSRVFLQSAACICAAHGGFISGERDDGCARGEFLHFMCSSEMLDLLAHIKHVSDPGNLLNPGVLAAPMGEVGAAFRSKARTVDFVGSSVELQSGVGPLNCDLRRVTAHPMLADGGFVFTHDGGDFMAVVHRCTSVGKCRVKVSGTLVYPSYLAARDEKDVTRGHVHILQGTANSRPVKAINSLEILEVLDLCLVCKACSIGCPAGVDTTRYRPEALFRIYRGRLRPLSHCTLGWLPRPTHVIACVPDLAVVADTLMSVVSLRPMAFYTIGLDSHRDISGFQSGTSTAWVRRRSLLATPMPLHFDLSTSAYGHKTATASPLPDFLILSGPHDPGGRLYALVRADSLSQTLDDTGVRAVVNVLKANGFIPIVTPGVCCGFTWITTGQLTEVKKHPTSLLGTFAPLATSGIPIAGVEPSCMTVLRNDLVNLLPDDPRSALVSGATHTLVEILFMIPVFAHHLSSLEGVEIVAQPHCYHYSVMGRDTDQVPLESLETHITRLEGCRGLAGNFGMEAGHYDLSVMVVPYSLLSTLSAHPETACLTDDFSCRAQVVQLADCGGVRLATLLVSRQASTLSELTWALRLIKRSYNPRSDREENATDIPIGQV